jgi:hypothetical protein
MSCITSSSFVVLINREAMDFFRSGKGIRQGCPLSLLLFILVMEGLSLLMKDSLARGAVSGIKVSRMINILHILFVDDVIIMSKASTREWLEIVRLLGLFCKASGLSLNQQKTFVLFEGIIETELDPFKSFLPFSFSPLSGSFRYLGYNPKTRV